MSETPSTFSGYYKSTYQGKTALTARPPWDIGEPQTPFVEIQKAGLIKGEVLDAGCGNGEISLFLAAEGHHVTGIDIAEGAIARRTAGGGAEALATFAVRRALDLSAYESRFETVVDCGCSTPCPRRRRRYAAELHRATSPGPVPTCSR
uniref:Methyl transferase n=1 Tax=Streptomyces sp. UC 11065 TaxID=428401 RepID=A3R4T8_9ACTN|nr:methyl transferase [Streptomyces sp. UC 11065]